METHTIVTTEHNVLQVKGEKNKGFMWRSSSNNDINPISANEACNGLVEQITQQVGLEPGIFKEWDILVTDAHRKRLLLNFLKSVQHHILSHSWQTTSHIISWKSPSTLFL